jgi:alcohol dehydrogenase class IV
MRTVWNFFSAGQLTFGRGAVGQIGELAARRQLRRVLLVTDANLVAAGIETQVRASLQAAGLDVQTFATEAARRFVPQAILGLGGGSNIDVAKFAAVLYTHGGRPRDYFGFDHVPGPVVPLICVPTTAGTGSEVSHAAVLTDAANQLKVSSQSNYLRPVLAVVDPALTDGCPRRVTADAGIDALTHAIEAYTAVDYETLPLAPGETSPYEGRFPITDGLAEQAIALIGRHLVAAVQDGNQAQARDGMALAATLAGLAFSNAGVALVHALEYPIGGAVHCTHGAGNGLLLPYVMRFNLPARTKASAQIARLLGEPTAGLSEEQAAQCAVAAVERIRRQIGIPERLRDLGVRADQLPVFAEKAFAIRRLRCVNPRVTTLSDLLQILQAAW